MKKIIAADPGSIKSAISVLHEDSNKIILDESHQLPLEGKTLEKRLAFLYDSTEKIIKAHPSITEFAIEATFVQQQKQNQGTGESSGYSIQAPLKLSMARGILYGVAGKYNIECFEYDNRKIKQIVCGNANCGKRAMIERMSKMFKINAQEDEAFSIGIGVCHILMQKSKKQPVLRQDDQDDFEYEE